MIVSMTGFGQGEAQARGERFILTLKSVNHRYFETAFHLPPHLEHLEGSVRSRIQRKISRGRINITLTHLNDAAEQIMINEDLVEKYHDVLERVRRRLKSDQSVDLSTLVGMPGVLRSQKAELGFDERERLVKSACDEALKKLVAMRLKEGAALESDLKKRVSRILSHMTTIKRLVAGVAARAKKTMPPENLEGFLRSTDVSEEITRIDFHLKSLSRHMKLRAPKGKVLDFIGQELQREINTLGAKVQEKHVAYQVVMVKDQIEKIREQVQNVE